jgi:hypothetical protein
MHPDTDSFSVVTTCTYTLDGAGNRVAAAERVLGPALPRYLPVVLKGYGGVGEEMMGGEGQEEWLPEMFESPLLLPEAFDSPLEPAGEGTPPDESRLFPFDPAILLIVPLAAAVVLGRRKKGRQWLAVLLLTAAVVGIGVGLAEGKEAGSVELAPVASSQSSECVYPDAPVAGTRVISYTYDGLNRLTGAACQLSAIWRRIGQRPPMD